MSTTAGTTSSMDTKMDYDEDELIELKLPGENHVTEMRKRDVEMNVGGKVLKNFFGMLTSDPETLSIYQQIHYAARHHSSENDPNRSAWYQIKRLTGH